MALRSRSATLGLPARVPERCGCGGHRGDAAGAPGGTRRAPSSCSPSAPASARRCSPTASSCPTPSSVTSRCTARDAEEWASARVRTEQNLDFPAWIARVNEYLDAMHALFWPDVFILGGAVSERYRPVRAAAALAGRDPAGAVRRAGRRHRAPRIAASGACGLSSCGACRFREQAARRRDHHLHGDVAPRARARRAQSRPGLSRLRHRSAAHRARRPRP